MKYSFDSVLHVGLTFDVHADSFDEAVEKARALKNGCNYWEFPDVCIGETELHLCYFEEIADDKSSYLGNICDEWV